MAENPPSGDSLDDGVTEADVSLSFGDSLDGGQTLNEAHAIGAGLRHAILDAVPNSEVIIHKDPVRDPTAMD